MASILLIEDDSTFTHLIENYLSKKQHSVSSRNTLKSAIDEIELSTYQLVLLDYHLPDGNGFEFLNYLNSHGIKIPVIMMTSFHDIRNAVKAIHLGATDYITKPVNPEELLLVIEQALLKKEDHVKETIKEAPIFIKGESEVSQELNRHIELIAPTNMSVVILGESGTGKENIARSIHRLSPRADGPFVAIDCGALSEELASSELFGHIKGAFTGALFNKKGAFETAEGGTLFLDEVGNLTYPVQVKLLRAIQEREIQPIGSSKLIKANVRIITATNDDMLNSVKNGSFREDLYHRINEFSIRVPALRNREDDLELFVQNFINQANTELSKHIKGLSPEVMRIFRAYNWPGNIRELKNIVKRSVLLATGPIIELDHIPFEMRNDTNSKKLETNLKAMNEVNEKELIIKTLKDVKYNKSKAATALNIDRKTLYLKIARYGIEC